MPDALSTRPPFPRGAWVLAVLLASAGEPARAQSCTAPDFDIPVSAGAGMPTNDIVHGDFNRDGKLDVATADGGASATVRFGNGSGGFLPGPVSLATGPGTNAVALTAADLDRNGTLDLAVAVRTVGGGQVRPFLGNGGGGFTPGTAATVGLGPAAVKNGDFNRDGLADVVVSHGMIGELRILLGNGTGGFTSGGTLLTGVVLGGLAVRDFDRDGRLDAAVGTTLTGVVVARGNGAGGFSGSTSFITGLSIASRLAAGDLDQDGDQDLVVIDTSGSDMSVLRNDGAGGFGVATIVTTPSSAHSAIALGDFNRDGRLDVTISGNGAPRLYVALGDGSGSFGAFSQFASGNNIMALALADLNADGRLDIALADNGLATLLMNKSGIPCERSSFALASRGPVDVGGANPASLATADFNGDGNPDVASVGDATLAVALGDGKRGLAAPTIVGLPAGANASRVGVADFNLDGAPDLVTANSGAGSVSVLLNTGTFGAVSNLALFAKDVVARDFDGDGAPDIVAVGTSLSFAHGLGNGTFAPPVVTTLGFGGSALAAADIDANGTLDLAVVEQAGNQVHWFFGDGSGGFSAGGVRPVGLMPVAVALGDLNGDGRPDLAIANRNSNDVSVLLNTAGSFGPAASFAVGTNPLSVQIADADGDNDADVIVADNGTHQISVLVGNGSGAFPTRRTIAGGTQLRTALVFDADRNGKADLVIPNFGGIVARLGIVPADGLGGFGPAQVPAGRTRGIASGDLDRDGRVDLVATVDGSTSFSFLRGLGNGSFAAPLTTATPLLAPQGIAVADFNRDGAPDVVVGDAASVAVFLGNGAGGFVGPVTSFAPGGHTLLAIDVDRDGRLDLVSTSFGGPTVFVVFGDDTGAFGSPVSLTLSGQTSSITALDFDRDGLLDLAVGHAGSQTISLLRGQGVRATPFVLTGPLTTGPVPLGLVAQDFDRDGFVDLAVGQANMIGYFRGTSGGFLPREDYASAGGGFIAASDVNGDGRTDILAPDGVSVAVLPGTGSSGFGAAFLPAERWVVAQEQPGSALAADFDGDAWPDLLAFGDQGTGHGTPVAALNSNCEARRLRSTREPARCNLVNTPFATQPRLQIEDDGANPIQCDFGPVAAQLVAGTPGAALAGTSPLAPLAGVADWLAAPLPFSLDLSGGGYRLKYTQTPAGGTVSRSLAVQPSGALTGPTEFCLAAGATFSAPAGYDVYRWELDGSLLPLFLATRVLPGGSLAPGAHTLRLTALVDSCPAIDLRTFQAHADLAGVALAPVGPLTLCATCTGPTMSTAENGGGAITGHRWGYRVGPGFPVTFIPGETAASYLIHGMHFPGPGVYELVEESTPTCGAPVLSNPVSVQILAPAGTESEVQALTATATDRSNRLEWVNPAGFGKVRVRFNQNPAWLACLPPVDPNVDGLLLTDQLGPVGGKDALLHGSLLNDTTYCYSVFVERGPGNWGPPRSIRSRPFDNTAAGAPSWAFSNGSSSMSPPGLGPGSLHVTSNDGHVYAALKATSTPGVGGTWPSAWRPLALAGPSQSRPTTVPIAVGTASNTIFLGSQSGALVAADADRGQGLWLAPVPPSLQAGPAGMFRAFAGAYDMIVAGTRDGSGANAFHSVDPFSGNPLPGWPYVGEAGNEIGIVSSQAVVHYATRRAYFTSYAHVPGTTDSVWCVDLDSAARCAAWPAQSTVPLGDVAAGPTLRTAPSALAGRLYVAPVDGSVHALHAANGTELWSTPFAGGDGSVKNFVLPDTQSGDLYFSTASTVWALTDSGSGFTSKWSRTDVPSPSQPVFFAGTARVWVGAGDGRLYLLRATDGATLGSFTLGDGLAAVGAPTVDQAGGFVYVGTDAGVVYAVRIP